jgi:hypothetical protein
VICRPSRSFLAFAIVPNCSEPGEMHLPSPGVAEMNQYIIRDRVACATTESFRLAMVMGTLIMLRYASVTVIISYVQQVGLDRTGSVSSPTAA